jgi:hypothetical protein
MTLDPRKHAKKEPLRIRRSIAEKRRRPTQSEASAVRATRGGNTPRPGNRR